MSVCFKYLTWDKLIGALLVLALHALLLYAAISYKLIPPPEEAVTLMVSLIHSPPPIKEEPPLPKTSKPPPKKVILDKPKSIEPRKPMPMLVAEATVTEVTEYVAPPPAPVQVLEAPVAAESVLEDLTPKLPASVTLTSELSLACPQRTPPSYPAASRRMGEQGRVVLRVALDETGRVTSVKVKESSGHRRLDEAGLSAIKNWQCNPAMRDGVAVRAEAFQPFDFILN